MKTKTKIKKLIKLREEILLDAKEWKGDTCPLYHLELGHYGLAQLFTGLGCWKWTCPFCGEEFSE